VLDPQFGVQHVPLASHTAGEVHVPQLPPQPSSPQSLPVQFGVQQMPNPSFEPPPTQSPLFPVVPQQLRLVRHVWPSALHGLAVASRRAASITTMMARTRTPASVAVLRNDFGSAMGVALRGRKLPRIGSSSQGKRANTRAPDGTRLRNHTPAEV
jgi:hypothetical protein